MQFKVASALVQTTTHQPGTIVFLPYLKFPFELHSSQLLLHSYRLHQPGTTHCAQWDVAPTCCCQGFPGSWQFFLEGCRPSHCGSKHSLSPTVCLNHTVIHKYLINTELYLNFSKYNDELLVAKSLTNIPKFTHFKTHFP